ncbi:MAG: hypothetical protein R6U93_07295 [Dehalococcoidia bacterium]
MRRVPQPNVLFVNIGWAPKYDGKHAIHGGHGDIKDQGGNPSKLGEGRAFLPRSRGLVQCVVGMGKVEPDLSIDVVFVARNPGTRHHEIVGIYFEPNFLYQKWTNPNSNEQTWADASTQHFIELLGNQRPSVKWPPGRSMRRWVSQLGAVRYQQLFSQYTALI